MLVGLFESKQHLSLSAISIYVVIVGDQCATISVQLSWLVDVFVRSAKFWKDNITHFAVEHDHFFKFIHNI